MNTRQMMTSNLVGLLAFAGIGLANAGRGEIVAPVLALDTASTGVTLVAGSDGDAEATALQNTAVTLAEAIATAEQHTGGKAYDAGVVTVGAPLRIAVETNGPKGVQTVTVDARDGRVLETRAGGEKD